VASPDGRPAARVIAIILLTVAAASLGYGLYRVTTGHAFDLSLMTSAVAAAGLAAILFSRAKSGGG